LTKNFSAYWSFALFEILLSVNGNDSNSYIEANATRIHFLENMETSPIAFTTPEFFVIKADHETVESRWDLYVYHIPSMRHWEWRGVSNSAASQGHILRCYMRRCPPHTTWLWWISGASLRKISRRRLASLQFICPLFYASQRPPPNLSFHQTARI
jgi:hypothetical protein